MELWPSIIVLAFIVNVAFSLHFLYLLAVGAWQPLRSGPKPVAAGCRSEPD